MAVRYDDGVDGVSAFVLAGGKSSRMGADKALLPLGHRNFLTVALGNAQAVCQEPVIVGEPERYREYGTVLDDRFKGCGPLGGIHAALCSTQCEWNLILSVDLPMMTPDFLRWIVSEAIAGNEWITIPRVQGRSQTVCALYRRAMLPIIERALNAGELKVGRVFDDVPVRYISEEEIVTAGFGEDIFRNVNSPEDYEWVKRHYSEAEVVATTDSQG